MTRRKAIIALLGAAALVAAPGVALSKTRTVLVTDNYYGPSKLIVHVGDTIRWRWDEDSADVHDVKLTKAPAGVKKFASEPLAAGDSFRRKLTKAGKYHIICTFHEQEMTMDITVKKRPATR